MIDDTTPPSAHRRRLWRGLMILMVVGLAAIRFVYLAYFCRLDLAPDEAHYWDWSRNLDWSYYSKGPLVAWLIRASLELFGSMSISLSGSEMLAIRLPAVLCGSMLLVSLYVLSLQVYRSERLAFLTVFFTATLPAISAGSLLMTIDSPFICLWGWALVAAHRAVFHNECWAWIVTGLLVGLGILAKYTMGLWLFSLGWFLVSTPGFRRRLYGRGFWLMVLCASVCCLPILIWNWQNDWVTFRHVAGQAGVPADNRKAEFRWYGPLEYIGLQFALLIGYWFVAWLCAMIFYSPIRAKEPGIRYLWWMSAPTFVVFMLFTFVSGGQINWPVAAYLSGAVLMSAWLVRAIDSTSTTFGQLTRVGVTMACGLGVMLTIVSYQTELVRPALVEVAKRYKATDPMPIRAVDPTCRLRGWKHLCGEIDEVRRQIFEKDGVEPIIAGSAWSTPGELGFYCQGHPKAFSLGPYFGDRHSQYDLWRPNPISDAQVFRGKTFVVVSDHEPTLRQAFDQVSQAKLVMYRENDVPIAVWTIWICRGFRGIEMSWKTGRFF